MLREKTSGGSGFPFLLGRAFIEASVRTVERPVPVTDFPSFWEGLSLRLGQRSRMARRLDSDFPSFWEGLSLRPAKCRAGGFLDRRFPFLLGRAFIEAREYRTDRTRNQNFPSFLEGLLLRPPVALHRVHDKTDFPCFFVGTFIEARKASNVSWSVGGYFPSFLGGLSLRPEHYLACR